MSRLTNPLDPLASHSLAITGVRRWILFGFLGALVVLMLVPLYDAWVVNRAGMLINRVLLAEQKDETAKTGTAVTAVTAKNKNALSTASDLMEKAAARPPYSAARLVPIWRTYGAASALAPSDLAFTLLLTASDANMLDRTGELWLGEVASATNHPDEAKLAYQQVDASNLLISRGDAYMASGDEESAVYQYEYARVSVEAAIRREGAEQLLSGGQSEASLTTKLMSSEAERVTALYRIGRGLLSAGRPAEAAAVLEEALEASKTASPGAVVQQSLNLNLALALARTLPRAPDTFVSSDLYFSENETATYLEALVRIRALVYKGVHSGPTAQVCLLAGRALLLIGDDDQAVSLLRQAIHLDPRLADAYLVLGEWYQNQGLKLIPLAVYKQGVGALPHDTQLEVAYAIASYQALPALAALPLLQATARKSVDDPYLFAALGDCYLDLGLTVEARQAYEDGLRHSPNAKSLLDRLRSLATAGNQQ